VLLVSLASLSLSPPPAARNIMSWVAAAIAAAWVSHCLFGWVIAAIAFVGVLGFSAYWTSGMRIRQKIQLATWTAPSEVRYDEST